MLARRGTEFMFDPASQKSYGQLRIDYVIGNPNLPMTINLSKRMITSGRTHLYGSIHISMRNAVTVHNYLKRYKNTLLDGILVWVTMQAEKDNDGK